MSKIFGLIFLVFSTFAFAQDDKIKVVYHCDYDDEKRYNLMLDNIRYQAELYDANMQEFEIAVVTNGACAKLLDKTQASKSIIEKAKARIDAFGIKFLVCELGMKFHNVKKENLIDNVGFIELGLAEITKMQHDGYAYIKIQ